MTGRIGRLLARAATAPARARMAKASRIALPAIACAEQPRHAVALATIIRDEGRYLREWIDFHRYLGVSHFYIYDDGSTDDGPAILETYRARGLVTVIPWRAFDMRANRQTAAYAHALANFGPDCHWLGFFDVDEFVFPLVREPLAATLARYDDLGALSVVGVQFGHSGHATPPDGLVIANYRRAAPLGAHRLCPKLLNVKSFVQPSRVAATASAHYFRLRGTTAIGYSESRSPLYGSPRRSAHALSANVIRYNHYFTHSEAEFEAKRARPSVRGSAFTIFADDRAAMRDAIEACAEEDRAIDLHLAGFEAWRSQQLKRA